MNDSTRTAVAAVAALQRAGISEVVLAPGSRSAALAVVLEQADRAGLLRLHVRVDERTAAFLALGLAKGSHRPAAVVTTSGTAVANLHPAVLEAVHAGERLVVLSADRPATLRGTGSNQTTEHVGIFGPHVPAVDVSPGDVDGAGAAILAAPARSGPLHVNLQFAEPLLPATLPVTLPPVLADHDQPAASPRHMRFSAVDGAEIPLGPRTVVVAGDDAGPPSRLLAQRADWPLFAEPTSGARTGTHALRTYRLLLDTELSDQVERVVVVGHPTLSRPVNTLMSRGDLEVIAVTGPGGYATDPGRVARHVDAVPSVAEGGAAERAWLDEWRAADRQLGAAVDALAAAESGLPLATAGAVAGAVQARGLLVVGSSQPVRDLDLMMPAYPEGERRLVLGNRGLAGIDGTVSTAIGAALGRESTRSLAYVGDVTFLHDLTALVIGPHEPRPDLTIVVANDNGSAIFTTLEQGHERYAAAFERVFGTPHGVSIEDWCSACSTSYLRVDDPERLARELGTEQHGLRVIEVPLERSGRRQLDAELRALASARRRT